jgi:hypothetical protein
MPSDDACPTPPRDLLAVVHLFEALWLNRKYRFGEPSFLTYIPSGVREVRKMIGRQKQADFQV